MNINAKAHVRNEYNIKCIDTLTGNVTADYTFHNVVLNRFIYCFEYSEYYDSNSYPYYTGIAIGNGSGTPAETDEALFSHIKDLAGSNAYTTYGLTITPSLVSSDTMRVRYEATIPADASNVYDITEVGILGMGQSYNTYLITHAMILDSEGNPITIHKTDTDKVIITADLYLSLSIPALKTTNIKPMYYSYKSISGNWIRTYNLPTWIALTCSPVAEDASTLNKAWGYGYIVGYPTYAYPSHQGGTACSFVIANGLRGLITSRNAATRTIVATATNKRLKESTMQTYIKGLSLTGIGSVYFPNEEVFPRQKLEGITVGVGDGETTEFRCPLNYFMKDTDVLYVDGVALTRGVDYELDNENNNDGLVELSAGNDAAISGGYWYPSWQPCWYPPIFRRYPSCTMATSGDSEGTTYGHQGVNGLSTTQPLFFDFGKPTRLNTLRLAKNNLPSSTASYSYTFTLYGRNSEEDDWTEITSIKVATTDNHKVTFDAVEYRYAQLTLTYGGPGTTAYYMASVDSHRPSEALATPYNTNTNTPEGSEKYECFLGYIGEGIKFTNPPAQDAIITMDAYTDLPMVSPNNVLDTSITLTLTF